VRLAAPLARETLRPRRITIGAPSSFVPDIVPGQSMGIHPNPGMRQFDAAAGSLVALPKKVSNHLPHSAQSIATISADSCLYQQ
jgi:hypothetical protein